MKKCVRYITAWLLTVVMVAVTVFQWGGLAADSGGSVKAAGLVDLSDEDTNDVRIEWKNGDGEFGYTGAPLEPEITLKVNGRTVSSDNYTVEYKNNTGLRTGNESAEVWVYGIESRGYTGSCYAYFHIKEGDLSKATVNFDGGAYYNSSMLNVPYVKPGIIQPKISSVMYGDTKLYENKDYIISVPEKYEFAEPQPVNTTASFSVKGKDKSNWSTTSGKTVTWKVVKTNITKENTVNIVLEYANCMYDGTEKRPTVTVEDPRVKLYYANATAAISTTLTKDEDYTVTYENNTNAGTAKVVITGMGGYTGSVTKEFTITDSTTVQDIAQADITAADASYTGKSVETEVKVVYNGKTLVKDQDYTVSYKDNISVGDKTATAVISGKGDYVGTKEVKFSINKKNLSDATIQVTAPDVTYVYGSAIPRPTVTVKDTASDVVLTNGTDYRIDYTGDYPETVGQYAFTITAKGGNYTGSTSGTYRIQPLDASKLAEVSLAQTEYEYTGEAFMPAVTKVSVGTASLEENKDYTVSYNDNVDAGDKAQVIVTFKGNYTGSKIAYFTITSPLPNLKDAELTVSDQTYTGKQITPAVGTVTIGGRIFTEGKDYTVSYGENKNTGYGQITLAAVKGNEASCAGTKLIEFKINPANINQSCTVKDLKDEQSFAYTGSVIRPKFTVLFGDRELTADEDYAVQYGNDNPVDAGSYLIVINGKGNFTGYINIIYKIAAVSIDGASVRYGTYDDTYDGTEKAPEVTALVLKDGTRITDMSSFDVRYEDRINAGTATITVAPKSTTKNYTGTASTTFVIHAKSIAAADIICEVKDATYKGSQIQPKTSDEIKVTRNGKELSLWTDYKITSYGENINVSKGSVVIEGVNNYTGQKTVYFTINPQSITGATVNVNRSYTYNGKAWEPQVSDLTVSVNGRQLSSGDYTITGYDKNTDAGTATVTVAGVDNYTGTETGKFTIAAKSLQDSSIDVRCATKVSYEDGKECKPLVRVKDGDKDKELTENVDYTVTYENNTAVTTEYSKAKAVVKGMGNYTGEITKEFEISKDIINITGATVTVNKTFVYNGSAQAPEKTDITVKLADGTVLDNTSYTIVAVKDNIGAGTATITVEGCGDYSGTASGTYEITPKNITECQVHYSSGVDYTGMECRPGVTVMDGEAVELTKDKDYTVSYSNNINPGTATITIKGQGNYTGTYTGSFTIVKKNDPTPEKINLSSAVITVADQTYTGKTLIPSITVVLNGAVLPASAYTIAYSNNVNVGTATVTVTGQGNYVGSASATFTIKAAAKPVTPTVTKPGKVKGISVKSVKTTSATLKWKKVSGASGYMIYRKNPSTGKSKLVKTVSSKTVSYKATKLKSATKYTYTIYAYKLSGKTKIKGSGTAYTFVTKPGAVKKTKAVSKKTKTCVVSWKKTKGADGYEVYMATSKKGKYKKIGQTKKLTLTKKKLKKGKTCYFKVRAYKTYKGKKTYGAYTKVIKAKIK